MKWINFSTKWLCSGADQRKHQSSASLTFARGIDRWPVNTPHKGPVTRKIFPFDDVIMCQSSCTRNHLLGQQCQICAEGLKENGNGQLTLVREILFIITVKGLNYQNMITDKVNCCYLFCCGFIHSLHLPKSIQGRCLRIIYKDR